MNENLSMPWPRVALGLGLVSIAALTTLVIVVAVEDVDVLATVALSLAVLAFGAQLVTTISQAQASAEQRAQAERLNNETLALLRSIETRTEGLSGTVEGQYNKLLDHLIGSVPKILEEELPDDDPAEEETRTRISNRLVDELGGLRVQREGVGTAPSVRKVLAWLNLTPGDKVVNPLWGEGKVVAVREGPPDGRAYVIELPNGETEILRYDDFSGIRYPGDHDSPST